MAGSVRWFAAALIVASLASAAEAQTTPGTQTPTLHARAKHHARRRHVEKPEGRQITVQKSTPSWLTLGDDARVGAGNNYVTSTFDQPSAVQGTAAGYRGRERLIPQYSVPGAPLFSF